MRPSRGGDPTVSVVLPTRNGIRYLDQAVGSVLDQIFEDWQLILVDDASDPPTATRVDHWSRVDPRIRAVHLPVRRHLPGALNRGFDRASGRYWGWISDDNRYRPLALDRFVDHLDAHPRVDVIYSDYTVIDHDGREKGVGVTGLPEDLPTRNVVGPSFLFRPGVFTELGGYDESMRLAEAFGPAPAAGRTRPAPLARPRAGPACRPPPGRETQARPRPEDPPDGPAGRRGLRPRGGGVHRHGADPRQ